MPGKGMSTYRKIQMKTAAKKIQKAFRRRIENRERGTAAKYQLKQIPVKHDVYINAECVIRPIVMGNLDPNGDNKAVFARYDYSSLFPGVGTITGINDSVRFNDLRVHYREYAITGIKIEIVPSVSMQVTE